MHTDAIRPAGARVPTGAAASRPSTAAGLSLARSSRGRGPAVSALDAVFEPGSVAVYGASRQPAKLGHVLLRNVLTGGFRGRVVAVNPSREEVLGLRSVDRLQGPVDLALVSVPAAAAPTAVEDAARAGCRAAIVLSSGFGETGPEGKRVEERMRGLARAAGMRLVGPNCMGVVSRLAEGWFNGSYFWRLPGAAGPVSLVSQSGAFGGMFFAEARRRGLGVARFLSVGNSADVELTEVVEWLADDPATGVVGAFVEGFRDGRGFVEAAERCTARKPLVVLKAGKQRAGARAAASHTGSLAGSHGAARAAFRRAGVTEAADSDHFFDLLSALTASAAPAGPSLAVLTISGGPGVLAADAAERLGLRLPPPSAATRARVRELAPPFAAGGNPVDLTPQCPPDGFPAAVRAVFEDPAYDGVVVIDCGLDVPELGQGVVEAAAATGKPVTAFVLEAPRVEEALRAAGIPLLPSPERAVAAYRARVAGVPGPDREADP
jgi:acyl-CoA synthetase (NDP forming)